MPVLQKGGQTVNSKYCYGCMRPIADSESVCPVCGYRHGQGETLVGIHDFTGDNVVELVIGSRTSQGVVARIYQLGGGKWKLIGKVGAFGSGVSEIRVFRQALTVKDKESGALHTWTCHGGSFDFKSSAGGPDPTPSNL